MSLIERAIARLTEVQIQPSGSHQEPVLADEAAEQKTTIEKLADRLAEAARTPVREPATAAPELAARTVALATSVTAGPTDGATDGAAAGGDRTIVPGLVRIHLEALRARGMVVPDAPATPTAHEFRVIKRPLLDNAFGRSGQGGVPNGRRVMVTSAFPGEGKSFCAINLAISIASERDNRVILVDADVARPSLPRELGIQTGAGLMDWLQGNEPDLSQLVLRTNVDKLSILPAGRRHEQATELLASEAMGRLLDELSELYPDCIFIFDSPPLLVTTEAPVLASYMGQVVMVVEAGKTPRSALTQALATIESNEIIGLVLNKAQNIETSGYYRGYGYGAS